MQKVMSISDVVKDMTVQLKSGKTVKYRRKGWRRPDKYIYMLELPTARPEKRIIIVDRPVLNIQGAWMPRIDDLETDDWEEYT